MCRECVFENRFWLTERKLCLFLFGDHLWKCMNVLQMFPNYWRVISTYMFGVTMGLKSPVVEMLGTTSSKVSGTKSASAELSWYFKTVLMSMKLLLLHSLTSLPRNTAIIFSKISINNNEQAHKFPVERPTKTQRNQSNFSPAKMTATNYCHPLLLGLPFWLLQTRIKRSYLKVNFLLSDRGILFSVVVVVAAQQSFCISGLGT